MISFARHLSPVDKNKMGFILFMMCFLVMLSGMALGHGMSEAEKQAVIEGGNMRYLWLGVTHMLSGYDHLAFVFGIIFFLTTFKDIAKYVTAFTVGHSITLIYATFNAIQLNYFLIDAIIGLSVCYIAFANIDGFRKYLNVKPPNMMAMIIGLGLIHGFGLSTRLQELPLSEDQLLLNIISFNVGIELGQIGALALMLLLIAAWRKTHFFQTFSKITNYFLIMAGVYLFMMQMHGYEHTANEELASGVIPAAVARTRPVGATGDVQWRDTITVVIPARGDKEYKIMLAEGESFDYWWQTDGAPLFFDFHGEPAGDTTGFFQSFAKNTDNQSKGSLTGGFTGTHGWYWKNNSREPVTITLKLGGNFKLVAKKVPEPAAPEQSHHESID